MDNFKNECNDFIRNKIWTTKKCRILAEERHKIIETALKIAIVAWTTVGLIIVLAGDKNSAYYSAIITGTIFGISSLSFSINFSVKSSNFKQSYIALSRLEERAKLLLIKCDEDLNLTDLYARLEEIKSDYYDILEKTDNHSNFDYERIMVMTNNKDKVSKVAFYSKIVLYHTILLSIIITPIILLVILWKS